MASAKKCFSCNYFYNTAVYSECPYCKNASKKETKTDEEKGRFSFGGKFKRTTKSETPVEDKPVDEVVKKSDEDIQKPPVQEEKKDVKSQIEGIRHTHAMDRVPGTAPLMGGATNVYTDAVNKQENTELKAEVKKEVKPEPTTNTSSLSHEISRSGRTVGKYISNKEGESIAPVVGWLVATKGSCLGQSFNLKKGRNKVGRSHEMDVKLLSDESVSRACVAIIIYDAKSQVFSIQPGDSDDLCYVNDTTVYDRVILNAYDEIEFGDGGYNKYIFVPFCGEKFQWTL